MAHSVIDSATNVHQDATRMRSPSETVHEFRLTRGAVTDPLRNAPSARLPIVRSGRPPQEASFGVHRRESQSRPGERGMTGR